VAAKSDRLRKSATADDLGDRTGRVRCNERVQVVGHHLHLVHDKQVLSRDFVDRLLQSAINRRHPYRPPVLGAPHAVVLNTAPAFLA
jgi:hypothetical protein